MTPRQSDLLELVVNFYVESHDFNGMPILHLVKEGASRADVIELVKQRKIDVVRDDIHPNPHIKALEPEPADVQIQKLVNSGPHGCLYPTPEVLLQADIDVGDVGPYTKALRLGAPQLSFRVFDLRALEWYRNDPRIELRVDDIHGTIIQRSGTQVEGRKVVRDELDFFEFGFAYNSEMERSPCWSRGSKSTSNALNRRLSTR